MNWFGMVLILGVGAFAITLAVNIVRELVSRKKAKADNSKSADDEVNNLKGE